MTAFIALKKFSEDVFVPDLVCNLQKMKHSGWTLFPKHNFDCFTHPYSFKKWLSRSNPPHDLDFHKEVD